MTTRSAIIAPVPLSLAKSIAGQLVFVPGRSAKRNLNALVEIINQAERAPVPLLEEKGGET